MLISNQFQELKDKIFVPKKNEINEKRKKQEEHLNNWNNKLNEFNEIEEHFTQIIKDIENSNGNRLKRDLIENYLIISGGNVQLN